MLSTSSSSDLDQVFSALAVPQRRQILEALSRQDLSVEALSELVSSTTWNTLKHVRVLEAADLVASQKIGRRRICRLNFEGLHSVTVWTTDLRSFWNSNLLRLEEHLNDHD